MTNHIVKYFCFAGLIAVGLSVVGVSYALSPDSAVFSNISNHSDEHIVWKRAPIKITLPVGKERFVTFPKEVQFGYNTNLLPSSILHVENDNQTLYLYAKKSFATQRTEAKLSNGEIVLLDINAKNKADDNPIDIVLPKAVKTVDGGVSQDVGQSSVNYVTLTRFAVQKLYAPQRLLKESMSITRFPMNTKHSVALFYDGSVSAMPLASWRGGDYYVTALLIKNLLNQPLRLDPRLLCGDWKTATFYPQTTLAARATPINQDTSTLFLVSNRPFSQAIQFCLK
ncbi:MAG: TIGR03749 family integrating conjugative element protein [Coxiellaceae bacterium]|nr:TIGR03749 family integrating conjugative element protein [Coxiellaceae bacterium]